MSMTDAEVQQAVLKELKWDTRVRETEIGVEVHGGVVTLSGTVYSWAKRIAAQEAAHRVHGVLDVANEIEVRSVGSAGLTDTEIAGAVRHALEWDVFVPEHRIRSTVSNGWVMLEGDVDCWSEKREAENALKDLSGVKGITNIDGTHSSSTQSQPPRRATMRTTPSGLPGPPRLLASPRAGIASQRDASRPVASLPGWHRTCSCGFNSRRARWPTSKSFSNPKPERKCRL